MSTLLKTNSLDLLTVQRELKSKNMRVFTPEEFKRAFYATPERAKYFLETYVKRGFLIRLKKGLYSVKDNPPEEGEIANALWKPSYISFEYALGKYGIIPEMVCVVTSATTKSSREFSVNKRVFSYYKIKKKAFTGYVLDKGSEGVLIAEPEKAVVDYLYFVSIGRKTLNERLDISGLSKEKLNYYAELYRRRSLSKLIETL